MVKLALSLVMGTVVLVANLIYPTIACSDDLLQASMPQRDTYIAEIPFRNVVANAFSDVTDLYRVDMTKLIGDNMAGKKWLGSLDRVEFDFQKSSDLFDAYVRDLPESSTRREALEYMGLCYWLMSETALSDKCVDFLVPWGRTGLGKKLALRGR